MKHFTKISKFAAIGFSLNACEEKEKASKPTEAAVPDDFPFDYTIKSDLILTGSEMIDYNDFNPNDKIVFKGDKMTLGSDTYERVKE
jgi:hypothetical protein